MDTKTLIKMGHPTGECSSELAEVSGGAIPVDTYGGRVHVEWDSQAAVTPLGQLPFFIDFLKTADLYERWVEDCPLAYRSNNAPKKRDVLGTLFLSILSGQLQLMGWTRSRRVIVLRREVKGGLVHVDKKESRSMPRQLEFEFMETLEPAKTYEYAVLVTTLEEEIRTVAQHYRDRADVENNFDELKNQWGWGGYTTHDLKRCQILARCIGLIYNWWSLFVRLAIPHKHAEGITSRPLLLHGVAKQSRHGGQTTVTITSTHGKTESVQRILRSLMTFLFHIKANAEQLRWEERWRMILSRVFRYFLRGRSLRPSQLLPEPVW